MITLIIFGILCITEFLLIYIKIRNIKEYVKYINMITTYGITPMNKMTYRIVNIYKNFRKFIYIPITILCVFNLIVALILSSIISLFI